MIALNYFLHTVKTITLYLVFISLYMAYNYFALENNHMFADGYILTSIYFMTGNSWNATISFISLIFYSVFFLTKKIQRQLFFIFHFSFFIFYCLFFIFYFKIHLREGTFLH